MLGAEERPEDENKRKKKKKKKAKEPKRNTPNSDHLGFYKLLEVPVKASDAEITKTYRRLSLIYHPDKATGSTEAFQQLGQAYSVLHDSSLRALYDMGWTPTGYNPSSRHDQEQSQGQEDAEETEEEAEDEGPTNKRKRAQTKSPPSKRPRTSKGRGRRRGKR